MCGRDLGKTEIIVLSRMLAGVLAAADSYSTQAAADPKYDGSQVYVT